MSKKRHTKQLPPRLKKMLMIFISSLKSASDKPSSPSLSPNMWIHPPIATSCSLHVYKKMLTCIKIVTFPISSSFHPACTYPAWHAFFCRQWCRHVLYPVCTPATPCLNTSLGVCLGTESAARLHWNLDLGKSINLHAWEGKKKYKNFKKFKRKTNVECLNINHWVTWRDYDGRIEG